MTAAACGPNSSAVLRWITCAPSLVGIPCAPSLEGIPCALSLTSCLSASPRGLVLRAPTPMIYYIRWVTYLYSYVHPKVSPCLFPSSIRFLRGTPSVELPKHPASCPNPGCTWLTAGSSNRVCPKKPPSLSPMLLSSEVGGTQ